jgi:hypothetical protein
MQPMDGWCAEEEESHEEDDEEQRDAERDEEEGQEAAREENGDKEHQQLLARVSAGASRSSKRTVVLNEYVPENEHSIAAARHDSGNAGGESALGLEELLHATNVSQAEQKQLRKLAAGARVRARPAPLVKMGCASMYSFGSE